MKAHDVSRRAFLGLSGAGLALTGCVRAAGTKALKMTRGTGPFPEDFIWGAATASYQVEGAANVDGRGPSVWDVFCRRKGAVFEGQSGAIASDHYHRYKEDIALMKRLGVTSYRFSVSWPRVLPAGVGAVNGKGLDFYSRLVDELGKADIMPMCTVFHWDYPEALYKKGGWLNRDSADWFAEYTTVLADNLSDRVDVWVTQNEPQVFIGQGHLDGVHAPGDKLEFSDYLVAAHNAMRAHSKSVQALRARARNPKSTKVGYALAAQIAQPMSDAPEDVEAARTATFWVTGRDQWNNAWWTDPVLLGKYPEDGLTSYGKEMPSVKPSDLDEMKQPLDFIGLNVYLGKRYRRGADGKPEHIPVPPGYPRGGSDWQPITPACMYWGPRFFHDRYKLPIWITENGVATRDHVFLDGKVHDPQRIDFMHRHLLELVRAINDGVAVAGYYAWSLLDNFEWADGYKLRFGLVYVDFQNQRRVPKDSFDWYEKVIATHGRSLLGKTVMPAAQVTP
jgi:beta-glucosidase